jgi:1,4-dihydroxy-2-naphthoate octaprenyltransferase
MTRDQLGAWIQASRPPFFVVTFVPLLMGWIIGARASGESRPGWFALVVTGSFLIHLATNLANDLFDHIQGTDAGESIGGSRVIQQGKISVTALTRALLAIYGTAGAIGVAVILGRQTWGVAPLYALALFSSIFYVAPPVRYGYRGLGELSVGLNMGPVMLVGTEWVIAGSPSLGALLISLPVGFMVASILFYQSLPDLETDRRAGKMTLAVKLGRRFAPAGFAMIVAAAYASTAWLVLAGLVGRAAWLAFLGIPYFVGTLRLILTTRDWVDLDRFGYRIRILYFANGLALIVGLLTR